mgnify:CR=1 FL=1
MRIETVRSSVIKSDNICGKWKVAALVIADELSVNVHAADLIYSSKMQKKPLTFCIQAVLWQLEVREYHKVSSGKSWRFTWERGASGEKGTKICPSKGKYSLS